MKTKRKTRGFFIVEVLIVLVLLSVLTLLFLPNLQSYVDRAKFADVIRAANSVKPAIELCMLNLKTVTGCTNGANGVPAAPAAAGHVTSVTVLNGLITATATAGLSSATLKLQANLAADGSATWDKTGTCLSIGLC